MIYSQSFIFRLIACLAISLYGLSLQAAEVDGEIEEIRFFIPPEDLEARRMDMIDDVYERQVGQSHPSGTTPEERSVLKEILQERPVFSDIAKRMQPKQFRSFVRTRARLLNLAYGMLRPISWNKDKLAKRMSSIDDFVIESADAIAMSNRTGFVFSISGAFGLGISKRLLDKIRSERIKRFIPETGGFYYVLAAGGGIYIKQVGPNKNRLVVDVFVDFDRLQKIHTYAGEVSAAINWGVAVDQAEGRGMDRLESHYIGILGVVRKSVSHFSYSLITGLALPPYLPVGMVYTNETFRPRATALNIPWFKIKGRRCENLFEESGPH